MENKIYDESTGISYTLQGDYYIPDLALPQQEDEPIGVWGQRHSHFLKENHKVVYYNLLTSGKLNRHLADVNEQSEEMFSRLVKQLA